MKRLYTMTLGLMMSVSALFAQKTTDIQFVTIDAAGNETGVVEDGAVIDNDNITIDDFTGNYIGTGLAVKNVSGIAKPVQLAFEIVEMDNGDFSSCFGGNCIIEHAVGQYYRPLLGDNDMIKSLPIIKAGNLESLETEWMFADKGKTVVKFTAYVCEKDEDASQDFGYPVYFDEKEEGPSVTMNFLNGVSAGIKNVESQKADNAYYDLMGRKVANPSNGIYIKNGKKIIK